MKRSKVGGQKCPPRRRISHLRRAAIDTLEPRLLLANVSINEIMAVNATGLTDEDGAHSDWIELRNSSATAQSLNGFYLTDDPANLNKWQFPNVSVPANGFLIVFSDDKDRAVAGSPLHTNFNLDRNGETLSLVNPDGVTVESQLVFGAQEEDISYGPDPGTAGNPLRYYAAPTPGAANVRSQVIINEIHYDPDIKTEQVEFIELYNPSPIAVSLSNAFFSAGITYTFPAGASMAPNSYLVLTENAAQFQTKFAATAFGVFTGSLSNDGESITLRNASGGKLERVDYGAGFPWPTVGDAPGNSIQLINPDFDNGLGGNWRSALPTVSAATGSTTLISSGSAWDYRKGTSEASNPTSAWRQVGFVEDSTWLSGATPIGYDPAVVMGTNLPDMRRTTTPPNNGYNSVFLRKTFNITDPAQWASLRTEALYDDGFNMWINGTWVMGDSVSSNSLAFDAPCGCAARENNNYISFNLPPPANYLRAGTNVITAQFHNVDFSNSSDAFFDARLIGAPVGGTAGAKNTAIFATNAPPQMRQVENFPKMPASNVPVTITAKITDPNGVTSANLQYQLVDPGSYISLTDAAYATTWTSIAMHDDGLNGDVTAGDGLYTVIMPASLQVNRRLIRYRISATDSLGASITAPYADDPQPNFAYFVYDGAPAWTGADHPGVTPPVTYSAADMNRLPIYTLISKTTDVADAQHIPPSTAPADDGSEEKWLGTLVYDGEVYDHIGYRARGGVWRYAMGKNKWQFNFLRNHSFQGRDNYGNPYPVKWDGMSMSGIIDQGDYWHRGEQGMFEAVTFKLFQLAGVPAQNTQFLQFRVVDNASETGATQYDGDLWGMYLALDADDSSFLDARDLPDGNVYRMQGGTGPGGGTLMNQGATQPTDNSDLVNFTNTYINTTTTDDWWRQNLDLNEYYSYRSIVEAVHHYDVDQGAGKNYFYYHNSETNQWEVFPWDVDLTWSNNMFGGGDEPFRSRVLPRAALNIDYQNRLRELRDLLYNPDQTNQLIDEYANFIDPVGVTNSPVDYDRAMWDYNPIMTSGYVLSNKSGAGRFYQGNPGAGVVIPSPGGFRGMVQKMKDYVASRGSYIDSSLLTDTLMPNKPTVSYIGPALYPIDGLNFRSSSFSGSSGTFAAMKWRIAEITNPSAPGYDPNAPKLYEINPSWESPEITTFNSDITIPPQAVTVGHSYRVRVRMKDSTGRWSHWSDAVQFIAGQSPSKVKDSLRITEINYNPSSPPPAAPIQQNDEYEFIEIKNIGSQVINLLGVNFSAGIDYTFGDISLAAGESMVLAKNPAAFNSRYVNTGMKIAPTGYTGTLDNGGEQLILKDGLGQTILNFTYDDLWQPTTDGGGYTLQIVNPLAATGTWNNAASWRASLYVDGTPGADEETLPQGSIVINEILSNSDTGGDWIELYNSSGAPINIGGWYLSDVPSQPTKFKIPTGTTIAAGGYLVFTETADFGNLSNPNALVPFAFNDSGDDAVLSSANKFGVLSGYDHEIHFDATDPMVTMGRYTNSGGSAFAATSAPTQGAANAPPRVGPIIINEINYNPSASGDEFIELLNITTSPVQLFDPANPANTWKFTKGVTFSFPQGITMPAGTYMLLVAIDPATFRTKYSIPASVPIYQYTGVLDNNGETISLAKPAPPEVDLTVPYIEMDRVDFDDVAPWPTTPDGLGATLGKKSPTLYGNDPASWEAEPNGGTPGALHFDASAPTADIVDVTPDPRTTGVSSITINFSEPVSHFDITDLVLTRNGGTNLLTAGQTLTTTNNTNFTLNNLSGITWVQGSYNLTLSIDDITDLTAHPLANPAVETFNITSSTLNPGNTATAYVLKLNGVNLDIFENNITATPTYRVRMSDLNALTITTGTGADSLTLDFAGGNPIPTGGLFFNAGSGAANDSLSILGGNTVGIYRPSGTTAGNGSATLGGRNLTFTGFEPATLANFSSLTFVTPNATDQVTVDSPSGGQTRIFGTSSGITFFATGIFNTPLMILDLAANDAASGNDSLTIGSSGTNTSPTTTLRLLSGAGADTININGGNNYIDLPPATTNPSLAVDGSATLNLTGASRLSSLSVQNTARVNLIAGGANPLRTNSLSIAATAKLDLFDNDLIVQATAATRDGVLANITNWVRLGRGGGGSVGGSWNGLGISSTTAATNPLRSTTLAAMLNDSSGTPIVSSFNGQSVDTNSILIKYTYTGDTNFDGIINPDDFARVDAGFATQASGYRNGDLDYNGTIDSDDFFQIDRAFGSQAAPLTAQAASSLAISAQPTSRKLDSTELIEVQRHKKKPHHRHQKHRQTPPTVFAIPALRRFM